MNLVHQLQQETVRAIDSVFQKPVAEHEINITHTKPDFEGSFTIVVFGLLKHLKGNPVKIGEQIGDYLKEHSSAVDDFNVIQGFLNLTISPGYWTRFLQSIDENYWQLPAKNEIVVLEYCGPNTNKPLHLGHVRNMVIGWSMAEILAKAGYDVHKVNIYNDRGIAISKSMVAWQQFGNGETPESTGIKGDHFVGNYYVKYAQEEKEQADKLHSQSENERAAVKQTDIFKKAQTTLQQWENGNEEVINLWKTMNGWVYNGFQKTFDKLGVDFEKDYHESDMYLSGKEIVKKGLAEGIFFQKEDGSVWVDLTDAGLDEKILLRADGTSVYITQDLGTAEQRFTDYQMDQSIYVVGNEQNYHFQVLQETLKKLGKPYAEGIHHLSYGMVDLPEGKMKSREGTVVDADDLIAEMEQTAKETTEELGKIDALTETERKELFETLGLGALKFFILRVDPRKNMLFDPKESIDFQGFTGPFVQYTHARIQSLLSKAGGEPARFSSSSGVPLTEEETDVIIELHEYQHMLTSAADNLDPSIVAKYVYDLAKTFNKFYANVPVNNEDDENLRNVRINLVKKTGEAIQKSLQLLGITAPDRM